MAGETEGNDGQARETPAQVNARGNNRRLSRIEEIARGADERRSHNLEDTDGEQITGRFQDGELDETPGAREEAARRAADEAEQSRQEQDDRNAEADRLEREEARRLQEEGGGEGEERETRTTREASERTQETDPEELVQDGETYYRTLVNGEPKYLSLKQLRAGVANGIATEETLRRAQEALDSATHTEQSPKPAPVEVDDKDLENIILSASMGDEEAVRKLATIVRHRPGINPQDVSRQVSQQIATQREVDRAEDTQKDLLGNETLAPVFRSRLVEYANKRPKDRIGDAYKAVGDQMRKDFSAMLKPEARPPVSKADRKRQIVNSPSGAGRQPARQEDDREVPVSEQLDAMARARGQQRAIRIRRS
jgi:hypothetical protein